jgi:hypothetical protein
VLLGSHGDLIVAGQRRERTCPWRVADLARPEVRERLEHELAVLLMVGAVEKHGVQGNPSTIGV